MLFSEDKNGGCVERKNSAGSHFLILELSEFQVRVGAFYVGGAKRQFALKVLITNLSFPKWQTSRQLIACEFANIPVAGETQKWRLRKARV